MHRLLCGDSTNIQNIDRLLDGNKVGMVFTDPMYDEDPIEIVKLLECINTEHYLIMATFKQCVSIIEKSNYKFRFDLVFDQKIPSSTMNKKVPYYVHKNIIYMTRSDETIFHCDNATGYFSEKGYFPSIIESKKNTNEKHGLTKNYEGIVKILSGFNANSVVDIFAGSGSTMAACHILDRKSYCIEISEKYCQNIIDMMLTLDKKITVKINGVSYEHTM